MKLILSFFICFLVLPSVYAEIGDPNPVIWPLHLDDIIAIFETLLAGTLGIIAWMAYKRDGRTKLLYVVCAFFIFTLKGFFKVGADFLHAGGFISSEAFPDLIADLLDFAVLVCFFMGMIKD